MSKADRQLAQKMRTAQNLRDPENPPLVSEREKSELEPGREKKARGLNDEDQPTDKTERLGPDPLIPERGTGAGQNREFVQNAGSFVYPTEIPPEYADQKPESRTVFESKSQALMEKMRQANMSINEIAGLWGMSKAGVWNRVGHIEPKPTVQPTVLPSSQPTNGNADSQTRQIPRISSEVIATRPTVQNNNGYGYETTSSADTDTDQPASSQPVATDTDILRLLFQREPEWIDVFLSIKAASVAAGYQDPVKFFHEQIWKDREDADFFRAAVPHEPGDQESLRENFALIIRQASAYAEAAKKSGLEMHKTMGAS